MKNIYVDNAATSFPKPKEVSEAMCNYIENIGSNAGRGTYESSYQAGRVVFETRQLLCDLFNCDDPNFVVFTANITESLNTLIKGFLKAGDHVIVSSMEHNAVMRPLNSDFLKGIEITRIKCDNTGLLDSKMVEQNIKANTRLIIMTHASNVCGTILPIEEVGAICKTHNIPFMLDSAQSAGVLDIDMKKYNLSALAFTGHKGLLGPQGIGGFIIDKDLAENISPLKEGGTGSFSEDEIHPKVLPDKFECGTLNLPGIYGLNAAIKFINKNSIGGIRQHEGGLTERFLELILNMDNIFLSGLKTSKGRTAAFSLNFTNIDNSEAAFYLDREFGIMTRVGLHCAPSAHKTLGTFPQGSLRISFGYFNTFEEVNYIGDCIYKLVKSR
jgi:cysteine desulfurase family protein